MAIFLFQTLVIAAPFWVATVVVVAAAAVGFQFTKDRWHLKHIAGPWQAILTDWWLTRRHWRGETFRDIALELHKQYGPVVRYGPRRVLFSDASAIPVIFSSTKPIPKADSYDVACPAHKGRIIRSLAVDRDEAHVSAIKRQIAGAFTTTAVLDYEAHINASLTNLISHLHRNGPEVNLAKWIAFFTYDTICQIAFSDSQDLMAKQVDEGKALEGGRLRFVHWHRWRNHPLLEYLLYKNPIATRYRASSILGELAMSRLQDRKTKEGAHHDLLDRYLAAGARDPAVFDPATILGLVISTINAGADTTAITLTIVLYNLHRNPATLARLREELDAAGLSSPPGWPQVARLRYLDACLKESMRLYPLILDPIEHTTVSPVVVAGTYVPAGTTVAMNVHALNRDARIWGADVDAYRPERWLEADDRQLAQMERANLYFSGGKRICLGIHVAWVEMKKALPELLSQFEIELQHPERPLDNGAGSMFQSADELLVRLKPREI